MIGQELVDQRTQTLEVAGDREERLLFRGEVNCDFTPKVLGDFRLPGVEIGLADRRGAIDPHA